MSAGSAAKKKALIALARSKDLVAAKMAVETLEKEGFKWRAVGDRENNFGLINIGSDPGHALVERITNAIDAVIEREALKALKKKKGPTSLPASPREAVATWFKVPGGRVSNLTIKARQEVAEQVIVSLADGGSKRTPTIEVRDYGVGLTPSLLPRTVLSLGETNKIDKPYLAGAYGQGGSTALAFSPDGTLFVSRRQPGLLPDNEIDSIAVTFARFSELDVKLNKNGRFEYLVGPDNEVASVTPNDVDFEPGTSVLHFNMDVHDYAAMLTQLTGSMWWLLQNTLFDPVLPVYAEERRRSILEKSGKSVERRTIAGNYTRLTDDKKDKIEHTGTVLVDVPHSTGQTTVRVNYWVVRQVEGAGDAQPIAAYVDPYRPIAYTFQGQTHGTDERRFTAERLALPYLAKSLVLQVELDHLAPHARRELLSTTRDRLKRGAFYNIMREYICSSLSEDEDLIRLNDERKERILSRHSEAERDKMRERFARLMERFKAGVDATAPSRGQEGGGRPQHQAGSREPLKPLPTKDEPTFIKIANTQKPIPIRMDRHALVRLESDAPDGYLMTHIHAKLTLGCDPEGMVVLESKSDFQGGRSRITIRPTDKTKPGDAGTITVFLFTPSEKTFTAKSTFKIEKPEEQETTGKTSKAKVQAPEPIPVNEDEWHQFGWNDASVAEVDDEGKDVKIYVNMDNRHIHKLLQQGGYQETGVKRMRTNYLLYVAFYAWAQYLSTARKDTNLSGKDFEDYRARELDRAAQTVVHAISAAGRLEDEE